MLPVILQHTSADTLLWNAVLKGDFVPHLYCILRLFVNKTYSGERPSPSVFLAAYLFYVQENLVFLSFYWYKKDKKYIPVRRQINM